MSTFNTDYGSAFLSGYGRGRNFSRTLVAGSKKNDLASKDEDSKQLSFEELLLREFKAEATPVVVPHLDVRSSPRHTADRVTEQRAVQMLNEFWT